MKNEAKNIQEWQEYIRAFTTKHLDPFIRDNFGHLSEDIKHRIKRQIIVYLVQCDVAHKDPDPDEITKIVNKEAGTSYTAG